MAIQNVQIVGGVVNSDISNDFKPIDVITDGFNGVNRLAVSGGLPFISNVTNFKSVSTSAVPINTTIYTPPQGATFYVLWFQINSLDPQPSATILNIGQTTFNTSVLANDSPQFFNGGYPIAIVQSGESISTGARNGGAGGPAYSFTFIGYEFFGNTQ